MMTEIARHEIPEMDKGGRRRGYAINILREFTDSGMEAATMEFPGKPFKQVYHALKRAQSREKLPVDVVSRKGKVFLIREEVE